MARPTIEERFWAKVDASGGSDACWLWTAAKIRGGFGSFSVPEENLAHRYSWFLHRGPVPQGIFVIHVCENCSCVNPRHLELSAEKCRKTHCPKRHLYDDENTHVSNAGSRHCKACMKERPRGDREAANKEETEVAA